ncbi:MAG: PKD domain-containing protein [Candidatus Latescibacteria bacterium]|nr:PKD domain-containing protein [Candidatus Latescibacterota bacterium]
MRKASGLGMGVVVVLAVMVSLIVGYTQEARGVVSPSQMATLPDVEAGPGETVLMPVTLSDVGDSDVIAAEMDITYDPGVVDVAVEGAVSMGAIVPEDEGGNKVWDIVYNVVYGDGVAVLKISMAGSNSLIGSGELVVIEFQCTESPNEGGSNTPVAFESMTLNEGQPSVETQDGEIWVFPPPVPDFSGTPAEGPSPLDVQFTDESTGEIDSWEWDFGDEGTSTEEHPIHEYMEAGIYTVCLTVSGPGGEDTETKVDHITVYEPCDAAFSGTPTEGTKPLEVQFTDASTGDFDSWFWNFGDGSADSTSTAENPSHSYAAAGVYTVCLTVDGPGGEDTETEVDHITVHDPPAAPTGLEAVARPDSVRLNWNPNTEQTLASYEVYRNVDGADPVSIATVNEPGTTYLDEEVETKTTYYYRLKAVDIWGAKSDFSDEVAATPWPYGDVSGNEAVQAYDAALILQQTVQIITLPSADWPRFTLEVGDVSGDGTIAAWDASLVLQHVVDLIPVFPVEEGEAPPLSKPVSSTRVVRLESAEHLEDGSFLAPIWIDNMDGVLSGQLEVGYDPAILKVREVRKGALLGAYIFVSNVADRRVLMSFASAVSAQGGGRMAEVVFERVGSESVNVSEVCLDAVQLNEQSNPVASMISISISGRPAKYGLAQNTPNPFNAQTRMAFDLSATGRVDLSIYNLSGQRVRTLVDEWRESGSYSAVWDGKDRLGREVASGLYLIRIEVNDFVGIRRMVLLR